MFLSYCVYFCFFFTLFFYLLGQAFCSVSKEKFLLNRQTQFFCQSSTYLRCERLDKYIFNPIVYFLKVITFFPQVFVLFYLFHFVKRSIVKEIHFRMYVSHVLEQFLNSGKSGKRSQR